MSPSWVMNKDLREPQFEQMLLEIRETVHIEPKRERIEIRIRGECIISLPHLTTASALAGDRTRDAGGAVNRRSMILLPFKRLTSQLNRLLQRESERGEFEPQNETLIEALLEKNELERCIERRAVEREDVERERSLGERASKERS
ncbi:hypothetical protein Sjap_025673 [Stephania japonica]|uniref:Uncharacterized protein n=1 Tax=Stephania japonica TaxID=461633 RepID=A0AAP0E6J8_9MAGN